MFPGTSAERRKEEQKILSLDIKNRCHLVFTKLYNDCSGDMESICRRSGKVIEATVKCYSGDCSMCQSHELVCSGGRRTSWWAKSVYLNSSGLTALVMRAKDKQSLRQVLDMKLSKAALPLLKLNNKMRL